ncbi:ABC transporter permease [Lachnotalea sp. AF33-28]|uniref:ABC transporter permease n=1 Tax=Lachnotalea sp. AF33-28 TaxID=2292046 RepID=UPI000E4DC0F1|nr:ABC transporter permease subunit [Lachnotalea sp. AF33-28]RHP34040.1 sugar ABC transporter permease [Lachnotalea sp. AF33-28]
MNKRKRSFKQLKKDMYRARFIYLMILPVVVWYIIFQYWPMSWLSISFFDYNMYKGFAGSEFIGFENFSRFFNGLDFWRLMRNVLLLNLYALAVGFPMPIIFALFLNEMRFKKAKKVIQTVSFLPYFISMVAFVSIVTEFLSPSTGLLADIMKFFGKEPVYFLGDAKYFRTIMVLSGLWQTMGYSAIVYLSALTSVDVNLYEAAMVDGANRFDRLWHITLPGITPTIVVMLILKVGSLVNANFEKIYLFQNSVNLEVSEVIQTWVYKRGMIKYDYSMGTTAGLFNGLLALILVIMANRLSKKYSDSAGIW